MDDIVKSFNHDNLRYYLLKNGKEHVLSSSTLNNKAL